MDNNGLESNTKDIESTRIMMLREKFNKLLNDNVKITNENMNEVTSDNSVKDLTKSVNKIIINDTSDKTQNEKNANVEMMNPKMDESKNNLNDKISKITVGKPNTSIITNESSDMEQNGFSNLNSNNSKDNINILTFDKKDLNENLKFKESIDKLNDKKELKDIQQINTNQINNNDKDIGKIFNKFTKEPQIEKSDILNQLIDKTKVLVTDDKSEIVISLKPETLGKITLKIMTENGVVMAKFAAESQQVKEVIEANMQILKDSLEKQGLTVEGFSVSVGNQSNKEANYDRKKNDTKGEKNRKELMVNKINTINISEFRKNHKIINPYTISQSQFNFTA